MTQHPEFSRPVAVDRLPEEGRAISFEATPAEREALARRFELNSLDAFRVEATLEPYGGGDFIRLSGRLEADLTQECGVTLKPVTSHIAEDFELSYAFSVDLPRDKEVELDLEAAEPPEPIADGVVDVGEAAAEQLALFIEPYPRAPGAEFEPPAEEDDPSAHPFAALAALKGKKGRSH